MQSVEYLFLLLEEFFSLDFIFCLLWFLYLEGIDSIDFDSFN